MARSWDSLSAGSKRRWTAAYGGPRKLKPRTRAGRAKRAYESGATLTKYQRGHSQTPSSPTEALLDPQKWPRYTGRHETELAELARQRGERWDYGGDRGRTAPRNTFPASTDPYTFTLDGSDEETNKDLLTNYDFDKSFRTGTPAENHQAAQDWARQSGAPPGIVVVVSGPDGSYSVHFYRYGTSKAAKKAAQDKWRAKEKAA